VRNNRADTVRSSRYGVVERVRLLSRCDKSECNRRLL
jgi:hypothetical protein